jgi:hypothetical protein
LFLLKRFSCLAKAAAKPATARQTYTEIQTCCDALFIASSFFHSHQTYHISSSPKMYG